MTNTKQRYIPKDSKEVTNGDIPAVAYTYEVLNTFYAIGYKGRATKHSFHYGFKTEEQRKKFIDKFFYNIACHEYAKSERRAKQRAFRTTLKPKDILYSSWGYEQTNIDFYQVIEVKNNFVTVREINKSCEETGWLQGNCKPIPDSFKGEPIRRKVTSYGESHEHQSIKIESYASASPWDGRPMHYTSYA